MLVLHGNDRGHHGWSWRRIEFNLQLAIGSEKVEIEAVTAEEEDIKRFGINY
jgi:hypothetical protein